ncbi:MAG: halocyanin domain-containing protein [Haloferacaceae archaeon]
MKRREFLRAAGGTAAAAGAAVSATGTAAAQSVDYGGWLDDVGNYDGTTVDKTGQEEVTINVGAEGNGGNFAFDPPAVQVDPGTKVTWEWTGNGGQHNVSAESGGDFESKLTATSGFTFSQTFEESGIVTYFCQPHRSLGMKGAIAVGDVGGGGGGGGEGGGGGGTKALEELGVPIQAHWVGSGAILGVLVTLVYTFYILKYGESPNTGNTGGGED